MSQDTVVLDEVLIERARKVIGSIAGWEHDHIQLEWMPGGGAHKNLKGTADDKQCMIKLWNTDWQGMSVMPPSGVVMENTRLAGCAGFGASVLGISTNPLAMVIEFIPGRLLDVSERSGMKRLLDAARRLHQSEIVFARDLNPFADARAMFACARQRSLDAPAVLDEICPVMTMVENVMDLRRNEFLPCHNDLYGANVLESSDGQVRLVDYDLAGNGDVCYELGFITTYSDLNYDQTQQLCEDYFGERDARMSARVQLMALAADYNSLALWTVAKGAENKNSDYDYAGEFERSLKKVLSRIDDPLFGALIKAARR
jgi:thiamine kinase-like enzyme